MRVLVQNTLTNRQWVGYDGQAGFVIGRDAACDVKLDSRFVSSQHARIERGPNGWEVEILTGANAVEVDGKEISAGQKAKLKSPSQFRLLEFLLTLEDEQKDPVGETRAEQLAELQNALHASVLRRLDLRLGAYAGSDFSSDRTEQLNRIVDDLLLGEFKAQVFETDLASLIQRVALRWRLGEWVHTKGGTGKLDGRVGAAWQGIGRNKDLETTVETAVAKLAIKVGFLPGKPLPPDADDQIDAKFDGIVAAAQSELLENAKTYLVVSYLKKQLYDMIFGLGPLEDLLRAPNITEIMVVTPKQIYIERNGRVMKVPATFPSAESATSIIERIVSPLGRRIDRSQPLVDARLRDGSRVNAIIEPLAIKGPCITIRKFPTSRVKLEDLIAWQSLSASAAALLRACILYRCNLLISGGTGSGKTTLLNVLSSMIPPTERLVTIEDSAELKLQQDHVVSLETKPANAEGTGEYTIRALVKNALRMRPDRIIVGECRGDESVDMLQAMNTGHKGSMTTIHSNNAHDAISRLETMVLMGAEIPLPAVRRQIAQAIDVIVHVDRLDDGRRMVTQIAEVTGLHPVSGEVESRNIMAAVEHRGIMTLRPTGFMPTFVGDMVEQRMLSLGSWFEQVKA